jgi:hypothetical protein
MRGMHFEAILFSSAERSTARETLRVPNTSEYMKILDMTDDIKRWSSACELE